MDIWAATLLESDPNNPQHKIPLFRNAKHLYDVIDNTPLAGTKWSKLSIKYSDFKEYFDYVPYQEFQVDNAKRQYQDFMFGDWAWLHADKIAEESPTTHRSMFVPVILGSDKTTMSVATGNNEYYSLYMSIGNVHNTVRRGHQDAVVVIGFLTIPKTDYEEQVLLACIVRRWCARCTATCGTLDSDPDTINRCRRLTETLFQNALLDQMWNEFGMVGDLVPFTNDFPRADIHQLIAPDLLHQLIKGTFKDHLVDWVEKFILLTSGLTRQAEHIMDDIDRHIAAIASFTGLCRFPQGRGFKQWTGNNSKALMKNVITDSALSSISDAIEHFHCYREVFKRTGIVSTFLLSCQHSVKHYPELVQLFGTPNGLCSSITENKHITAVKKPYRRLNKHKALGQILVTNQQLNKLSAAQTNFASRGMLNGMCLSSALNLIASITANNEDGEADHGTTIPAADVELSRHRHTFILLIICNNLNMLGLCMH
ncbi:hypothetical protein HD554DRAFT_2040198 [Boletus coccyginus]|nr:hypothetical protein HD554DRAFT_2040198 [Boletus coccyginus]